MTKLLRSYLLLLREGFPRCEDSESVEIAEFVHYLGIWEAMSRVGVARWYASVLKTYQEICS